MDPELNPYAPPREDSDLDSPAGGGAQGLRREGDLVLIPAHGVRFPARCVVCNQPCTKRLQRRLFWHPPGYYALACVGLLIYLIAAAIVRKSASFEIGLCDAHAARRRNGILLGWVGAPLCLAGAVVFAESSLGALVPFSLLSFVCAVAGVLMVRVVTARRIEDGYAWIRVGRLFLDSL